MKVDIIKSYLDLLVKIALSILLLTITFWIILGGKIHVYHHFVYQDFRDARRSHTQGIRLKIDADVNTSADVSYHKDE